MKHKKFVISEIVVILYTIAPILSVLLASLLAALLGCGNVNEGSAPDCALGGLIYTLFVAGWLGLVTIPTGLIALVTVSIVHVVFYFLARHE